MLVIPLWHRCHHGLPLDAGAVDFYIALTPQSAVQCGAAAPEHPFRRTTKSTNPPTVETT
jgi:hypothetical protein